MHDIGVSCPRDETRRIHKTQEVIGEASVIIQMMGNMIHNIMCVSSSINGANQSVEKQVIQGTIVAIQMMEDENHTKNSVGKLGKRHAKKKKTHDESKATLYVK